MAGRRGPGAAAALGPFRPDKDRKDKRLRDLAAMARAGFAFDIARKVIDAKDPDALDEE